MTTQVLGKNMGIIQYGSLEELTLGKNITGDKMNRLLYNADTPHHMGVKVSRIFTSMSRFYPKFFTSATIASAGHNYCMIDNPTYTWDMQGDINTFIRITKDTDAITENSALIADGMIGQGQQEFYIQLDSWQVSTGSVLLLDNNNFQLLVTNDGIQEGVNVRYSVRIQGSDELYGIPLDWLKQDKFVTENSSSIPMYGTPAKPGLGKYGTTIRLKNFVGKYGREFTVDENLVRMARKADKKPSSLPTNANSQGGQWSFAPTDLTNGSVFAFPLVEKDGKTGELSRLQGKGFISYMEMKIEDMLDQDREAMCHFGHAMNFQTTTSGVNLNSANTQWYVAAGLRDLLKLGHYKTHNGQLDVDMLQEYLHPLYMTRVDEIDRRTTFTSGELGKVFLHQMVNTAAQGFFNSAKGDQFIASASSSTTNPLRNELRFGYQFTQWIGLNGIEVTFAYNKMFDDNFYCRQMYAPNSAYTVDSARMEIYDFGMTNAASNDITLSSGNYYGGAQNCSMICVEDADRRHWRIGSLHPYQGWKGVSETNDTTSTYSRTKSGSPVIWDTTRCGAIVYEPLI